MAGTFAAPTAAGRVARFGIYPRFALAIFGAFAMHLALLVPSHFTVEGVQAGAPAPVMSVRLLTKVNAPRSSSIVAPQDPSEVPAKLPAPNAPEHMAEGTAQARVGGASKALASDARATGERTAVSVPSASADSVAADAAHRPAALPPAPDYMMGGTLDPGPRPLQDIEPVYPPRAGQLQGSVILRLLINERGLVDNAAVVRSSPPGFFEDSALEAFSAARFSPGRSLGVAVKSQVTIEVEFTPINRGAGVSGTTY